MPLVASEPAVHTRFTPESLRTVVARPEAADGGVVSKAKLFAIEPVPELLSVVAVVII